MESGLDQTAAAPPVPWWRVWLRKAAPYVVAGLAIFFILQRYSPSEIAREMERGNTLPMVPLAAAMVLVSVFMVGSADWLVMRGCSEEPPSWVAIRGKAGSAVLNVVGYAAHVGGYGVWIARVSGMGAGLAAGVVLFILSSELTAIGIVAGLSAWLGGMHAPSLRWVLPGVALLMIALMMLGPFGLWPEDRAPTIFRPWRIMKRSRALLQIAVRVMHIATLSFFGWAAANAFGLPVPLAAMFLYFPIVLFVGSMPVNVAGFGAVQGAWLLLEPWAPGGGEQVLAFSVVWQLLAAAGIVLRGLPFVRRVVAEIDQGKA